MKLSNQILIKRELNKKRYISIAIDNLLISQILFIGVSELEISKSFLTGITLFCLYYTFSEYIFGKTIGKYITGLKTVNSQNKEITFKESCKRQLGRILSIFFLGTKGFFYCDKYSNTKVV
ncbi:RDD family protein [Ichthyobacterium seriolicida]|nr:RDD family protein [Ichthyobacterium seriolicida]